MHGANASIDLMRKRRNRIIIAGCLALIVYIGFLLGSNYRSHLALQDAALDGLRLDIEKRAATVGYFLAERKNDLQAIVAGPELRALFTNIDLGISEQYGLKVNLFAIERLFRQTLQDKIIHGAPIYEELALLDKDGKRLVDFATGKVDEDCCTVPVVGDLEEVRIRLTDDGTGPRVCLIVPTRFKNRYRGYLVASLSSSTLLEHVLPLFGPEETREAHITSEDGLTSLARATADGVTGQLPDGFSLPPNRFLFFKTEAAEQAVVSMLALKIPVKNAPLALVFYAPVRDIYDQMAPWTLLLSTGSLAVAIFCVIGILVKVNSQNLDLRTRVNEVDRQRGDLATQKTHLEDEIELRIRVEEELMQKQRQVEERTRELQQSVDQTYSLAYYDTLTGLPNRKLCLDRLGQALAAAKRQKAPLALMFLDLDRFKDINDSLGHSSGDLLLKLVARRLSDCLRDDDTIARFGGDEFIVVLPNIGTGSNIDSIAQKLLDTMNVSFDLNGHEIFTSTSVGIALFPEDGEDSETLLKHADMAMYSAKDKGRNTYKFFSLEMNRNATQRREMEASLRQALEKEEFFLVYQPQVDLGNGQIAGFEALLRWNHPEKGLIPPRDFIRLAEEIGLIHSIGEWVIHGAAAQAKSWLDAGLTDFRVAVNISGRQFRQAELVEVIDRCLLATRLPGNYLELELTESTVMENATVNVLTLTALKDRGLHLAIDDFGTGYSSLSYLKDFPIDRIKIDQSFIKQIHINADHAAIVEAVIAMAARLGIEVVAEGVEKREQMEFLLHHQCRLMQGFYFAQPMAVEQLSEFLMKADPVEIWPQLAGDLFKPVTEELQ